MVSPKTHFWRSWAAPRMQPSVAELGVCEPYFPFPTSDQQQNAETATLAKRARS